MVTCPHNRQHEQRSVTFSIFVSFLSVKRPQGAKRLPKTGKKSRFEGTLVFSIMNDYGKCPVCPPSQPENSSLATVCQACFLDSIREFNKSHEPKRIIKGIPMQNENSAQVLCMKEHYKITPSSIYDNYV